MENKKDIGEVFKERFTDYTQSPNPKVWKAVEANSGSNFMFNKTVKWTAIIATVAIAVGAGIIYILSSSTPTTTTTETSQIQNTAPEQLPQNSIVADTIHQDSIWKSTKNEYFNIFNSIEKSLTKDSSITKKESTNIYTNPHQTSIHKEPKASENSKNNSKEKEKQQRAKDSSINRLSAASQIDNIQPTTKLPTLQSPMIQLKNTPDVTPTPSTENKTKQVENQSTASSNITDLNKDANAQKPSKDEKLWIPNAFAPNSMGNNVFKASGSSIKQFEMVIYNQKGEQVFTSKDINQGWNGKIKGTNAPKGAYPYAVKYTTTTGTIHYQNGAVNLITE